MPCLFACVSVESGVEVSQQHYVDPYYRQYQQGKRKSPSLSISLDLCFPSNILPPQYCIRFKCLLGNIRVSYQLHKFLYLYLLLPINHRIVVIAWVYHLCYYILCLAMLSLCLNVRWLFILLMMMDYGDGLWWMELTPGYFNLLKGLDELPSWRDGCSPHSCP